MEQGRPPGLRRRRRHRAALTPAVVLLLIASAGPAAATREASGPQATPALPALPRQCRPAPAWIDTTPDRTLTPAPGLRVRTWHGTGAQGVPVRVVAAEADTVRIDLSVAVPARFGGVLATTDLTRHLGAVTGMNGDYFDPGPAGAVPRGVEVQHGTVLYAPAKPTKGVGVDAYGALYSGQLRPGGAVVATVRGTTRKLLVTSVNAAAPGARGVAVRTAFGASQPRRAAWYVVVRNGVAISSSSRDPGPPNGTNVLLTAAAGDRAALAAVTVGARVKVRATVVGEDGRPLTDAVGSSSAILRNGAIIATCTGSYGTGWRPRSLLAWSNRRSRLWLITVNATSSGASGTGVRGFTYSEIVDVARRLGATDAVMLDGGHSTMMASAPRAAGVPVRLDAPAGNLLRRVPNALVLSPN